MTNLIASIDVVDVEEFDMLKEFLKLQGYRCGVELRYTSEVHSLQIWESDLGVTWDDHPASFFVEENGWKSKWIGDAYSYMSIAPAEINVEEYL